MVVDGGNGEIPLVARTICQIRADPQIRRWFVSGRPERGDYSGLFPRGFRVLFVELEVFAPFPCA